MRYLIVPSSAMSDEECFAKLSGAFTVELNRGEVIVDATITEDEMVDRMEAMGIDVWVEEYE